MIRKAETGIDHPDGAAFFHRQHPGQKQTNHPQYPGNNTRKGNPAPRPRKEPEGCQGNAQKDRRQTQREACETNQTLKPKTSTATLTHCWKLKCVSDMPAGSFPPVSHSPSACK